MRSETRQTPMARSAAPAPDRNRRLRALALALAGVSLNAAALAQDYGDATSADDEDMSAYEAKGLPFGAFRLFPELGLTSQYDSNVFMEENAVSDWRFSIAPSARLVSEWSRHEVSLEAQADILRNSEFSSEDRVAWGVAANGRVDVTRPLRVFLRAGYQVGHEGRDSPDEIALTASPTRYATTPLGVSFDYLGGQFGVRGALDYASYDWDPTERVGLPSVDNADRDRTDLRASLDLRYQISPGYRTFVRATYMDRDYKLDRDRNLQDRNSSSYSGNVGVSLEFTRLLVGEVFVGYQATDFVDAAFEDVSALNYGSSLTWHPTALTTVRLDGARSLDPSTLSNVGGVTTSSIGLSVDHALLRNVLINGAVEYADDQFEGADRTDRSYSFAVGGDYLMNRYIRLNVRYEHTQRDSDAVGENYNEDLFGMSLKLRL